MLLALLTMFVITSSFKQVSRTLLPRVSIKPFSELNAFDGYPQPETKENAYLHAQESWKNPPIIILVSPNLDQNVGSVARAMLNFGLTQLRIVNPQCDVKSALSYALASGASDIIENATFYDTLEDCVSDLSSVMATTVRPRHMTQTVLSPRRAAEVIIQNTLAHEKVGILFGRERTGLTNDEIGLADTIITAPTFKHFSSLNLAQAVNLLCYELWQCHGTSQEAEQAGIDFPPQEWTQVPENERLATRDELQFFLGRLEQQLIVKGFRTAPQVLEYRNQFFRNLRNIFQRTKLSKAEVSILHGTVTHLIRPDVLPTTTTMPSATSPQQEEEKLSEDPMRL